MTIARSSSLSKKANGQLRKILTAVDLLPDLGLTEVDIPELGGVVYVRPVTAGAIIGAPTGADGKPTQDFIFSLIVFCVVDAEGKPLFSEDEMQALKLMKLDVFNRLASAVTGNSVSDTATEDDKPKGKAGRPRKVKALGTGEDLPTA